MRETMSERRGLRVQINVFGVREIRQHKIGMMIVGTYRDERGRLIEDILPADIAGDQAPAASNHREEDGFIESSFSRTLIARDGHTEWVLFAASFEALMLPGEKTMPGRVITERTESLTTVTRKGTAEVAV